VLIDTLKALTPRCLLSSGVRLEEAAQRRVEVMGLSLRQNIRENIEVHAEAMELRVLHILVLCATVEIVEGEDGSVNNAEQCNNLRVFQDLK
jgi:hypothetical protein